MRDPSLPVLGEIVRRVRRSITLGQQRVKVLVSDCAVVIRNEDLMHFVYEGRQHPNRFPLPEAGPTEANAVWTPALPTSQNMQPKPNGNRYFVARNRGTACKILPR